MTQPEPNPQEHVAVISRDRLIMLIAIVFLIVIGAFLYFKSNSDLSQSQRDNLTVRKELENTMTTLEELKRSELRRMEEASVNASVVNECLDDLDRTEDQILDLEQSLARWQKTETDIHTTILGKRIASDETTLRQYQALQSMRRPDTTLPAKLKSTLRVLRKPLARAQASDLKSYRPGPDFENRLTKLRREIVTALEQVQKANTQLDSIIARTPSKPSKDAVGVDEALLRLERGWAQAQTEQITREVEKVRKEFAQKLAQEKATTERLNRELEIEREKRERAIEKLKQQTDLETLAQREKNLREYKIKKAERDKLEAQFQKDLAEIKSLLRPFISEGRSQPNNTHYELSVDVSPVSLGRLRGTGQLDRTIKSQRLLWTMTTSNSTNDRPLGSFPPYIGSAQDWRKKQPQVARAQELLIKYGELMVDKKMLAP